MFCAAVAATMLTLPAAANAAKVYQQQSRWKSNVRYVDTGGENNTVVAKVIMDGYGVLVTDSTATITTVAPQDVSLSAQPCTLLDEHRALCVNPTPEPEEIGGFTYAFLDMSLGAGDNAFELDRESIPPEESISTAGGDDVISTGRVVSAFVSDFDGSNTIRVGRTQRPVTVIGGRGPDRIDVKNGTGGDDVKCSWLDEIVAEGDRLQADRDDVIDADCG
jgi:hypothetical protein